jgi:succinate dehydrogenase/fumarate reductase flavoprotein subunit
MTAPVLTADDATPWDHRADVVVIGTGIAGCSTAAHCLDAGLSVVMVEKSSDGGGTSAKAAGGMMIPANHYLQALGQDDPREDFIRFLARVGRPLLYDAADPHFGLPEWEYRIIETYYDNSAPSLQRLVELGAMQVGHQPDWPSYNELPEDKRRFGRVIFSVDDAGEIVVGSVAIARLLTWITGNGGELLTDHPVRSVFLDGGRVAGVLAEHDGAPVRIRADRAVVFATGGFTHGEPWAREYLNGMYVGGCAARTSEGDIIPVAKALGVPLLHMHSAWGSPVVLEQALAEDPALIANFSLIGDSVFSVNKYGRRACNEKTTYNDRTQSHFAWDPARAEYPSFLQFAILDERARQRFARGDAPMDHQAGNFIPPLGEESPYLVRADTLPELVDRLRERLAALDGRVGGVQLADDFLARLQETIERFNGFARTGVDEDFHRGESAIELLMHGGRADDNDLPNETMYPLAAEGPYYATILAPGSIETKGGPKVNTSMQILDGLDEPVPGLYGVGNCVASASGQAYWSGGSTWGPYVGFGLVAARSIAAEGAAVGAGAAAGQA